MAVKISNNASSTLAGSILATSTSFSVAGDDAGKFPALAAGDWFPLTIVDSAGNMEIVRVTARSGAALTVVRGQEGTTAKAFTIGARCELRMTAATAAALANDLVTAFLGVTSTWTAQQFFNGGIRIGASSTGIQWSNDDFISYDDSTNFWTFVSDSDATSASANIRAGRLRLTNVSDASLTTTGHAFQIGPDDGSNLIMDGEEIQSRVSGQAETLRLQADGGLLSVGPGGILTTGLVTIQNSAPSIVMTDTTTGSYNTRIRVDANNWYLQKQADGSESWSTFMQFEMDTTNAYANGSQILTASNHPHINLGSTQAAAQNALGLTSAFIGSLTAGFAVGAIGSTATLVQSGSAARAAGYTTSASSLQYSNATGQGSGSPSGTWRLMGAIPESDTPERRSATWLRIS